jgi:hypothetical protein
MESHDRADEDGVKEVLVSTVLGLWDIVNNLTRLRPSKQERYRVTIFGSARAQRGTFAYEQTRRVAKALTELGCDIVTGGGPGLVSLPFEQEANAFVTQVYEHRTLGTPLIFVGPMWSELVQWARAHMLDPKFSLASPEDLSIPHCVPSGGEAIEVIREHHQRWLHGQAGAEAH